MDHGNQHANGVLSNYPTNVGICLWGFALVSIVERSEIQQLEPVLVTGTLCCRFQEEPTSLLPWLHCLWSQ